MFKYILLIALAAAACDASKKQKQSDDPFALMDQLVHYVFTQPRVKLWPWSDIFDSANPLEDPKLISNKNKCEIDMYVRRFAPEDLRVRVKSRRVLVEGRRKQAGDEEHFAVNRFVQNFMLPAGCNEDEVTAVYENGVLSISAPKHELPAPVERNVPIEVRKPSTTTEEATTLENKEPSSSSTEVPIQPVQTTSAAPLDQLDIVEATTHVGKIRKKELKTIVKTAKDNEVAKGEGNGLDYSLVDELE